MSSLTRSTDPALIRQRRSPRARAAALIALAVLAVSACSSTDEDTSQSAQFSYTDSRTQVIELDRTPTRIVASEQAAAALIPLGIKPVGVWGSSGFADSIPLNGLDLAGIESIGQAYGDINIEAVAALEPDVIVTGSYAGGALGGIGAGTSELAAKLSALAPILTVSAQTPSSQILDDYHSLAVALGAAMDSATITAERAAFDTAVANFKSAIAAKPGLTAMAVSPSDQFYIAINDEFPELLDYQAWGLNLMSSTVARTSDSGSFAPVSWENVGDYQPDLILLDTRPYSTPRATLEQQRPTWQFLAAATSGNIADWTTDATNNFASYTTQITALTSAINRISV